MLKIIVAGSRTFKDYELLCKKLDFYIGNHQDVEIVSGTAYGADKLGERYAISRGFEIKYFPANWKLYGKSAGYRRNKEMAEYATHAVIFWDGVSKGSQHMIDLAKQAGLNTRVVRF